METFQIFEYSNMYIRILQIFISRHLIQIIIQISDFINKSNICVSILCHMYRCDKLKLPSPLHIST